jgi:hypothetical protein
MFLAIIVTVAVGAIVVTSAQRPPRVRVSPHESVEADMHGAHLTITYGRPYMKGRVIYGGLVPWDKVWCPGADEATTLESTRELQIGSVTVPAGPHTIWVLPTEDKWTFIISKEREGFHTRYYPNLDLGRVTMTKRELTEPVEQLTFSFTEGEGKTGTIDMTWERTGVSVPFTVR